MLDTEINLIEQIEEKYAVNVYRWSWNEDNFFIKHNWFYSILLTSPHSVFTKWNSKYPEYYTWTIAEVISSRTGIFSLSRIFDSSNEIFCDKVLDLSLKSWIKFIFDIHWSKDDWNFDVEIWTWFKKYNLDLILDITWICKNNCINRISVNNNFKWLSESSLTNFIQNNSDIPIFQIEISRVYRNPKEDIWKFNHLIKSLVDIVNLIKKY